MWNDTDSGKLKCWQKTMYQRHIMHHKSHITFSVIAQLGKRNGLIYYVFLSAQSLSLKKVYVTTHASNKIRK
jgi:CRISPR/Cas system-associated protein Csx1